MSLMRLLSLGRSLGRATDEPTRYRMIQQGLPKFGLAEKPDEARGARAVEKSRKKTNMMQQVETKPWTPSIAAGEQETAQRFPLGRWGLFRNPFGNAMPGPKETRPVPAEPVEPVQGELSLEAVRPVRNDLTDSDVMVIRSPKAAAELIPAPALPQADGRGGSEAAAQEPVWTRLKSQLFGASEA